MSTASRYTLGIDLGTTHCALSWVDTQASEGEKVVQGVLPIPQLTAPGAVEARDLLPSFLYLPHASEFAPGDEFCPNLFIANDPEQDVAVVLRKTGLKSGRHGNATGVERVQEPGIAELALGAARTLGLTGPVDIDIRLRNDGTPLVLEINARFGANSANAPEVLDAVLGSRLAVAA